MLRGTFMTSKAGQGSARDGERGQAIILTTLAITVVFGLLGLTVDAGWMHYRQEMAQTAADSGAMAAIGAAIAGSGTSFTCGSANVGCQSSTLCPASPPSHPVNTIDIACAYAKSNGFAVAAGGRQSVYVVAGVGTSPPTAPGVTPAYWVTVRVSETIPQLFSAVLGFSSGTIAARSTAGANSSPATSCIYVFDPSAKQAFSVSGGSTVSAGCGIFVNSSNSDALDVSGGSTVTTTVAKVSGGYQITSSHMTPTPTTGTAPVADPFASVPAPSYSGCTYTNKSVGNGATVTLTQGVYCNGLSLGGGANVTMQAGVYVMNGGGFHVSNGAIVNGSGVTIYNTANGYTYSNFNIGGGATVTLAAPTTGTYRGILFFNDRAQTSTTQNTFTGGAQIQLTGSLYFPSTPVSYSGGTNTTVTAILAKTVAFSGGSNLAYDSTGSKTGLGSVTGGLVE